MDRLSKLPVKYVHHPSDCMTNLTVLRWIHWGCPKTNTTSYYPPLLSPHSTNTCHSFSSTFPVANSGKLLMPWVWHLTLDGGHCYILLRSQKKILPHNIPRATHGNELASSTGGMNTVQHSTKFFIRLTLPWTIIFLKFATFDKTLTPVWLNTKSAHKQT